ncbi:MAG: hypothetical protein M9892_08930 [Bacteroidetes bacterium]|nr:hypothetical protein [Bacteroidota bacterium]
MAKNARIIIPRKIEEFLILAANVLLKNDEVGVDSPLKVLDMEDMEAKLDYAVEKNSLGKQLALNRKTATQQRNLALGKQSGQKTYTPGTVLFYISGIRDFLLGQFRGEEQLLGDWGFDVKTNSKAGVSVEIPSNVVDLLLLTKAVLDKNTADGVDSPLEDFDMADLQVKYDIAKAKQDLTVKLNRDRETAFQQRDLAMGRGRKQISVTKGTLKFYLTSARDILLGYNRGEEQNLGDWGFDVDTSQPSNPTPPTPADTTASGSVINAITLAPVAEVNISFNTSSGVIVATSNPIGEYEATLEIPEMELVAVMVNHPGFQPYNEVQPITPNIDNEIDIMLQPL